MAAEPFRVKNSISIVDSGSFAQPSIFSEASPATGINFGASSVRIGVLGSESVSFGNTSTTFVRPVVSAGLLTAQGSVILGTTVANSVTINGTANIPAANITGGSISGITDLPVADGGTGASSAANARVNLGLRIGVDVQQYHPRVDLIRTNTTPGVLTSIDASTVTPRSIVGDTDKIEVTNPTGQAGNIVIGFPTTLEVSGHIFAGGFFQGRNTAGPTNCAFARQGTPGTGFFFPAANLIGAAISNVERYRFTPTEFEVARNVTNNDVEISLGSGRTGVGSARLSLIGDPTYTAFGFRIDRTQGANGDTRVEHRGTGDIEVLLTDGGGLNIHQGNDPKVRLESSGHVRYETGTYHELITFPTNPTNIVMDGADSNSFAVDIDNNLTVNSIQNAKAGQVVVLRIENTGVVSRDVTFAGTYSLQGTSGQLLSVAPGSHLYFIYVIDTTEFYVHFFAPIPA